MEGTSIIIPVFNKLDTTQKCIQHISEFNSSCDHEIIIVDNGSTDETLRVFSGAGAGLKPAPASGHIIYIRNNENLGVAKALNAGAAEAKYGLLCFMHNDVFVHQKNWPAIIDNFTRENPDAGVVGLYGAKTIRADSSFRGKSIVHSKQHNPLIHAPFEKVAVVDGLLMAMRQSVFDEVGGFSDEFIMHFYDKDMSLKTVTAGYTNYVLNIPFEHFSATTRTGIKEDDQIRDEARGKFLSIWAASLPVDVTTWRERVGYLLKRQEDR
jgi:GT2 family glycosyltransferase